MSDALILGISLPIITAVSAWVTIWLNGKVAAKLAAQIDEAKEKMNVVEKKLDENHKQMNGNLDKLVKTTADLATAKEKAKNKEENKTK